MGFEQSLAIVIFTWILASDAAIAITLVPPKLIPISRSTQLHKGERYHVSCSTSDGSPPLVFSWAKDGDIIESSESQNAPSDIVVRKLDDFSISLVVENVQENHSGNYSCTVSNPAGRDTGTTNLQVLYPPNWIRAPTDVSVISGNKISLICEAKGSPKPTVTWRRNTDFSAMTFDVIHSDGRLRISDDGQTLQIPESKKQDEGFYECHVSNGVGDQLRKTVRVEVQVPPKVSPGPNLLVIKKGKDVTIRCNMSGDSPLNIIWEKNGKTLESKPKMQIQEFPTDAGVATTLVMTGVDRSISGLYICKARNSYGESHRIINLDVVEHPGPPRDLAVAQIWSRSFLLTWEPPYSGNRPITAYIIHYWKTEGKSEPPPEKPEELRIETLQTSAVINNLLPNTIYSILVMAENEVGQSPPSQTVAATTREEEPDWTPAEVTVVEKHASSVRLKWKCPHSREWIASLKGYYVGYRRMSSKTTYTYRTLTANLCLHHQDYLLQGLQRASSYVVVVKAFNTVGIGPPSEQIVVHTADGGPPRSPHVKLLSTTGVTCNLKIWPKENSRNLPDVYSLHIKEQNSERQKLYVSVLPSRNYSVGGLIPGGQYEIYVTAKNEFGESALSQTLKIFTDKTDPTLMELSAEPTYDKMYFILPVAMSALIIIVLPLVACYCLQKSTSRQMQADSIEVRDFIYNAATIARIDATMRRASATMGRPVPARMSSLQRPPRTGRVETTTLPQPDPPQQVIVEQAPTLPTSYSTLQNYGTATTAAVEPGSGSEQSPVTDGDDYEDPKPAPNVSTTVTVTANDDSRYDSVVEEMRTLLKEGVTRPKKLVAEDSPEESS